MNEKHFGAAMSYVEQNPARARIVEHSQQGKWSSAHAHLKGEDAGLLDLVSWPEVMPGQRLTRRRPQRANPRAHMAHMDSLTRPAAIPSNSLKKSGL